jgi:putative DNA primase/helicase
MSGAAVRPEYVALIQRALAEGMPPLRLIPCPDPERTKAEILARADAREAARIVEAKPKIVEPTTRLDAVGKKHEDATAAAAGQPSQTSQQQRSYTDLGNTDYFVERHGKEFRFDHSRGRWLVWSEHRWAPDLKNRVANAVQSDAEHRLRAAVSLKIVEDDEAALKQRVAVIKWALQSQHRARIDNVLHLAKARWRISVATATGWDADPWLLGVPNGVVDLRQGTLRPGSQDDQITKHAGAKFNPDAGAPRWERFLSEVCNGDEELTTFLRRAVGYTLSGTVFEDCWFGCHGSGNNGKSTLFKTLHAVFGDYAYVASFSLVTRGYNSEGKRDFDIAYLQNTRFVMASETKEGGVWDEERLKRLTGRDPLHGEYKYGAEFNFVPSHKLWFMFNHHPRVQDHSPGFWRRVRLIPFTRQFGDAADKTLDGKLLAEREGILAWAVRACLEYQECGLTPPQAVIEASRKYEKEEDPLHEFIQKHVRAEGPGFTLKDVYVTYRDWCKDERIDRPLGKGRFGQLLETKGFERVETPHGVRFKPGRLAVMQIQVKEKMGNT